LYRAISIIGGVALAVDVAAGPRAT